MKQGLREFLLQWLLARGVPDIKPGPVSSRVSEKCPDRFGNRSFTPDAYLRAAAHSRSPSS